MGLRGELACFGVHIDALPGATLVAKHKHFCELDASEWHKPAVNIGFHYKLTEGARLLCSRREPGASPRPPATCSCCLTAEPRRAGGTSAVSGPAPTRDLRQSGATERLSKEQRTLSY